MSTHQIFESKTDFLRHDLLLHIGEDNSLTFDMCIMGEIVEESFGDFDYEQSLTVTAENKLKLCYYLDVDPKNEDDLVRFLREKYGHSEGYSQIKDLLNDLQIPYERFEYV